MDERQHLMMVPATLVIPQQSQLTPRKPSSEWDKAARHVITVGTAQDAHAECWLDAFFIL
jgi:hypothetical protein